MSADILIVEDSRTQALQARLILEQAGHRTRLAANGAEGLAQALAKPPNLVITDVQMPEMDGYELCRRLKAAPQTCATPVVILTSLGAMEDILRGLEVGADNFITKPYQAEELVSRVAAILANVDEADTASVAGREIMLTQNRRQIVELLLATSRQLGEALEQIKAQAQLKDEFLRIASHDLRNPLSTILLSAYLLEDDIRPGATVTEDAHEVVASIAKRAQEMQRIIEDFLDFRAMEDGQLRLTLAPTDLNEIARQVVENNADYARDKKIELSLDLDPALPQVNADSTRLTQVTQNLVGNAIKFGSEGSDVVMRTRTEDNAVVLEVCDSGPGLTDEDMKSVFVKYARLSNKPTGGEKSSGLGLAICKQLIELHGGEIGVRNNPGHGATFWFRLSAERPTPGADA